MSRKCFSFLGHVERGVQTFSSRKKTPSHVVSFARTAVEAFEEVSDSLCVPQYNADGEERVVLFLKMAPGKPFSGQLVADVKAAVRKALSARHVPALLLQIADIPVSPKSNFPFIAFEETFKN